MSQKTGRKDCALYVAKGCVPDKDVVSTICQEFTSGFGFATCIDGELMATSTVGTPITDGVMQACEQFKDVPLLFYFIRSTDKLLPEDVQPFATLKDGKEKMLLSSVLAGNYSESEQVGTEHTGAFWMHEKRLKPKFQKLMKLSDQDFTKMLDDLSSQDSDSLAEINSMVPSGACMIFLDNLDGITMVKSADVDIEKDYDWGSTIGLGEYPAGTAVESDEGKPAAAKPSAKDLMAMMSGKSAATSVPTVKQEEKKEEKPPETVEKKKEVVLAKNEKGDGFIEVPSNAVLTAPPADCTKKEVVQGWYKKHLGWVPTNWGQRPSIVVKNTTQGVPNLNAIGDKGKDLETKHLAPGVHLVGNKPQLVSDNVPKVLTANELKDFTGTFMPKILGANHDTVANPAAIREREEKNPSAANQIGKTSVMDFYWSDRARYDTCKEYPHFAAMIWRDALFALESAQNRIKGLEKELAGKDSELSRKDVAEADKVIQEPEKTVVQTTGSRPVQRLGVRRVG